MGDLRAETQPPKRNGRWKEYLWEIAVIFVCMLLLGVGVSRKEGYHMDELLSFELANAEFNPWIVPTQPQGRLAKYVQQEIKAETFAKTCENILDTIRDVLVRRGDSRLLSYQADVYEEPVWITGKEFTDYLTVDKEDAFSYLSVYFNIKDDNHPPLYFLLLHTVSSVLQGRLLPVMGCIINMVCVAVSMLFLMKLGRLLAEAWGMAEKGRLAGLLASFLYGCSTGAMATTLLIRMYGLVTCLCVILCYVHVKKWLAGEFAVRNQGMLILTVLGFWTQYFFLFYCLVLAAVTVVLLAKKGRRRELFGYIRTMLLAAVIGIAGFPFAIADVLSSSRGVEAFANLTSGLEGYAGRLTSFGAILVDRCIGSVWEIVLILLAGLICIGRCLLENKTQIAKAGAVCGEKAPISKAGAVFGERVSLLCMLVLPVVGYFLLAAKMSPYQVDRYIMPLFPFVTLICALCLVGIASYLEKGLSAKHVVLLVCAIAASAQLWQLAQYDGSYLYAGYREQVQLAREYEGYPCICVYDGVGYYENLPEFMYYGETLLVKEQELAQRQEKQSVSSLEEVVVLVKINADREAVTEILEKQYGLSPKRTLLSEGVHGDTLLLFGQ